VTKACKGGSCVAERFDGSVLTGRRRRRSVLCASQVPGSVPLLKGVIPFYAGEPMAPLAYTGPSFGEVRARLPIRTLLPPLAAMLPAAPTYRRHLCQPTRALLVPCANPPERCLCRVSTQVHSALF
jgi:hypothetical protein